MRVGAARCLVATPLELLVGAVEPARVPVAHVDDRVGDGAHDVPVVRDEHDGPGVRGQRILEHVA